MDDGIPAKRVMWACALCGLAVLLLARAIFGVVPAAPGAPARAAHIGDPRLMEGSPECRVPWDRLMRLKAAGPEELGKFLGGMVLACQVTTLLGPDGEIIQTLDAPSR